MHRILIETTSENNLCRTNGKQHMIIVTTYCIMTFNISKVYHNHDMFRSDQPVARREVFVSVSAFKPKVKNVSPRARARAGINALYTELYKRWMRSLQPSQLSLRYSVPSGSSK